MIFPINVAAADPQQSWRGMRGAAA